MYRHANYINCAGCGRLLSLAESEFDEDGRYMCVRCHTVKRVDDTLSSWRKDARVARRWLVAGVAIAAILFVL
jgi:hypothetical protein